jgi:hypothetical protein
MQHTYLKAVFPLSLSLIAAQASATGFEAVTSSGTPVLTLCEGIETSRNPVADVCRISGSVPTSGSPGSFPGQSGTWTLLRQNNNQSIVANGTVVGDMDDRVWRRNGTNSYIFGFRITMNTNQWTPPAGTCPSSVPTYFEVNDMFRNGFSAITNLTVAYRFAGADEGAWLAGRTNQGLNQYVGSPTGLNPTRNNDWMDFRTDVNVGDTDGTAVQNSSWMYVAMTLPNGVSTSPVANAVSLREGGEEGQCQFSINLSGYKPL